MHSNEIHTDEHVPSQHGKRVVITGGNSGLGLETAKVLVARGANVVIACRNKKKAEAAVQEIAREAQDGGDVVAMDLDLSKLKSVRDFAEAYKKKYDRLDVLVNNAGLMAVPRGKTADGFETQIGVNHMGHFVLTSRLLPVLLATPGSRVITLSSGMHAYGQNDYFDDIDFKTVPYDPWKAYGQSKLANLHFAFELARRLAQHDKETLSLAAHPGYAATELQGNTANANGSRFTAIMMALGNALLAQSARAGTWPVLRAIADDKAQSGDFFGPDGMFGLRGPATRVDAEKFAYDAKTSRKLWDLSQTRTGEIYRFD